ncbi:MAG: hypothetical protein R2766_06160 [Saprospiraceae bacterium]
MSRSSDKEQKVGIAFSDKKPRGLFNSNDKEFVMKEKLNDPSAEKEAWRPERDWCEAIALS